MTNNEYLEQILKIYPKRLLLSKKEVSQLTGRSISSLDRDIKNATGIKYKKAGGRILYPAQEVAKWMSDLIKTI